MRVEDRLPVLQRRRLFDRDGSCQHGRPPFRGRVNTKRDYEEIPLGVLSPSFHTFEAPSQSDWVVAVGGPFPDSSVDVDLGRVDEESGLYRVEPSDGDRYGATSCTPASDGSTFSAAAPLDYSSYEHHKPTYD